MKKILKWFCILFGLLIFCMVIITFLGGPTYRASHLKKPDLEMIATARQSSYLEEYDRGLIVKYKNEIIEQELFKDSGGYVDSNLFLKKNGDYLFEGSFDCYSIIFSPLKIIKEKICDKENSQYIGVFTFEKLEHPHGIGGWVFLDVSIRPYSKLTIN
jgi:hypothetical protein